MSRGSGNRRGVGRIIVVAMLLAGTRPALCAAEPQLHFEMAAQPLSAALETIAHKAAIELIAPTALLSDRMAPAMSGDFTPHDALDRVLRGSGLKAVHNGNGVIIRADPASARSGEDRAEAETSEIVVTGSRIRGAPVASTVIARDREDIRSAGQASLGDVVRSIPQNFGGGQNPGVGTNVPSASGVDVGGGSSINLRGIGSDATLTLLNGHRLSYSASRQSIDVSAIPIDAVERVEIVADGASAIYGSDAVAGVANITLRRHYDGLSTSARFGASTDGGNEQITLGALAGRSWRDGGVMAAYEYGHATRIDARQRAYAAERVPGVTLYPALEHHNVIVNGHQAFGSGLTFAFDGLYNRRDRASATPLNPARTYLATLTSANRSLALAPSLSWATASSWALTAAGMYGEDRTSTKGVYIFSGAPAGTVENVYRQKARSLELSADGNVLPLPGGPAKLALGIGFRSNSFVNTRGVNDISNIRETQTSHYAFGELSLPWFGNGRRSPGMERLNASLALRYEKYPGIGSVVTPKLGLIYQPVRALELKGSWGKSYRAPTFLQKYQIQSAYLIDAAAVGGAAGDTSAILLEGGNPALKPEKATSWSGTLALRPAGAPAARVELSYFNIDYRDRIVTPIPFLAQALSSATYRDLVALSPSVSTVQSVVAAADEFVNASSQAYDPANVTAIINNTNLNAGRQRLHGLDLLARYDLALAGSGTLAFDLNANYLKSRQQRSAAQPVEQMAGLIFNPPRWRMRGSIAWSDGPMTLTGALTTASRLKDERYTPAVRVASITVLDLALRYRIDRGPALVRGLDVVLAANNVLNDKPHIIRTTQVSDTPYDSTNASPLGRTISLAVTKLW